MLDKLVERLNGNLDDSQRVELIVRLLSTMYSENLDFDFGLMISIDQSINDNLDFDGYVFCTAMEAAKFSSLQDKLYDLYLEHHGVNGEGLIDEVTKIINKNKDGEDKSTDS